MEKKTVSNNKRNKNRRKHKKNGMIMPGIFIGVAAIIIIVIIMALDSQNKAGASISHFHTDAKGEKHYHAGTEVTSDADLTIAKSEVSENVKFYPYKFNNIEMEVLAVKLDDGTVKTALNTCISCYNSGKGYFEEQGDLLVCQNCGNTFELDNIGDELGECYPIPIPGDSLTVNEDNVVISKTSLDSQKDMFKNWRR